LPRLDVYSPPFPRTSLTAHFYTSSSHILSYPTYSAVRVPEILIRCDCAVTTPFNNTSLCHHHDAASLATTAITSSYAGQPTWMIADLRTSQKATSYLPLAMSQDPVFRSTRFRTSKPCRDFYLFGASFPFPNSFFPAVAHACRLLAWDSWSSIHYWRTNAFLLSRFNYNYTPVSLPD
jgi:hypothetical protein